MQWVGLRLFILPLPLGERFATHPLRHCCESGRGKHLRRRASEEFQDRLSRSPLSSGRPIAAVDSIRIRPTRMLRIKMITLSNPQTDHQESFSLPYPHRVLTAVAVLTLAALIFVGCASEPSPPSQTPAIVPQATATPDPTPEPTATKAPEPTVAPASKLEPTPEPTPEPTAEPTPEATAEPTAEPTPEATAEPTPEPTPEATAEPTPEATPDARSHGRAHA